MLRKAAPPVTVILSRRRVRHFNGRITVEMTCHSSLAYLQAFPFDKIKIDKSFISSIGVNPQSAAIVRAVIGLARGLDLPVVAEGANSSRS